MKAETGRGQARPLPYTRFAAHFIRSRVGAGLVLALANLGYCERGDPRQLLITAIRFHTPVQLKCALAGFIIGDLEVAMIVLPDLDCQRVFGSKNSVHVNLRLHIPRLGQVEIVCDVDGIPGLKLVSNIGGQEIVVNPTGRLDRKSVV